MNDIEDKKQLRPITNYGSILKAARKHKNYTQEQLAHEVGGDCNAFVISKLENDIPRPSLEVLIAICRILDLSLTEVLLEDSKGNLISVISNHFSELNKRDQELFKVHLDGVEKIGSTEQKN